MFFKNSLVKLFSIAKPPQNCKPPSDDDYYSDYSSFTCEYKGATYVDLDEVPSEDNCNSCYCDYGEIVCSKDLCTDEIPGVQSGNIHTVMDIT